MYPGLGYQAILLSPVPALHCLAHSETHHERIQLHLQWLASCKNHLIGLHVLNSMFRCLNYLWQYWVFPFLLYWVNPSWVKPFFQRDNLRPSSWACTQFCSHNSTYKIITCLLISGSCHSWDFQHLLFILFWGNPQPLQGATYSAGKGKVLVEKELGEELLFYMEK